MKKQKLNLEDAAMLRQKAEKQLIRQESTTSLSFSETDTLRLIHELEVHQIELEMQNEELIIAKERAELAEEKFTELYDFAPSGYISLSKEGEILGLNFVAARMLDRERSYLIKKRFGFFVSIDTQTTFNLFLQDVFTGNQKQTCEVIIATEGNMPIYVNIKGVLRQDGEVCCLTLVDITERKRSEIELQESEAKFKNIVSNMQVGILLQGANAEILLSNPKALELLGLTEDQLLGKTSFDPDWNVIHEDGSPFPSNTHPVPQAIASRKSVQNVIMGVYRPAKKDRVWLLVDAEPQFNEDGTVFQVVCSFIDVSKRKQIEEQLIKAKELAEENEQSLRKQKDEIALSNDRLESLLHISQFATNSIQELLDFALNEAITLTQSKIGYIYFYSEENQQFILNTWSKEVLDECQVMNPQTVYDLDKTGFWGETVRQRRPLISNDFSADNPLKKGTPTGHVELLKFLTIPVIFENKIVAVAGVANKATDYDNSDVRQLTLLMDTVWKITERMLLIEDLKSAKERAEESDRLKSAFLANMSHEIRTPMNGILGFAQLLSQPNLSDEEQIEFIQIIQQSGKRMLNIINEIVDISKIEAGLMKIDIKETNIYEQIEYIYTFFKPESDSKGIQLIVKKAPYTKDTVFLTDREKLSAVLVNLVKNAIKYTDSGSIEFGYYVKEEFIEYYVKDTGIGIPKDRQEAIFKRFIQADVSDIQARQGAGLGLSISKAYIEMLGGEIWVESEKGKGSTFYFTLPYKVGNQDINEDDSNNMQLTEDNLIQKLKILIAEDDEISEKYISMVVRAFGDDVFKTKRGNEAVEICRNNPDIELILMDIQMPDMNGYEATRQIRQFNKDVIIIAQTAYGLSGDREKALAAGANDYIAKPINKVELLEMINKYFKK